MFDTSFHFKGKQLSGSEIYEDGLKLADTWLTRKKDAEMANIKRQTQDITDPDSRFNQMIGLAKQSKRSPWLIADLEAEKSAAAQAEIASREKMANINETISKANKNNADASQTVQKTGQARMDVSRPMYEVLGMSGNVAMGKSYLEHAKASGAIDDDTYQSHINQLDLWQDLSPEEIKAVSLAMAKGQLSPEYLYQTANNMADNETKLQMNALDNETSRLNNQNTVNAQMYGHDLDYQGKIDVAQLKHEQEMALQRGQVKSVETGTDGNTYLVYADGRVEKALDGVALGKSANGEKAQSKQLEYQEKVIDFDGAISQVNDTLTLIDDMKKQYEKVSKNPYLFKAQEMFYGTDEYTFKQGLETLKSNVFLSQVEKMKGMGALTDAEGARLEVALGSLNPYQDPQQFMKSLNDITRILHESQQRFTQKRAIYANHVNKQGGNVPSGQTVNNPFDSSSRPSVGSFFE